jgi:DNA-binding beta-propeller fold protein YncE
MILHLRAIARLATATAAVVFAVATPAQAKPVKLVPSGHILDELRYPESVAVAPSGSIYVVDRVHDRVQELTPAGEFVLMFGKEVNKKGSDVCTKAEASECQAGAGGTGAGAFEGPFSVAVAPGTQNVYVVDVPNNRVDEYTAGGEFLLMFGKEVNKKHSGICTKAEASECQAGVRGSEHGAFEFQNFSGNLLTFGPAPEHLLYAGDAHRVQKFNGQGEWKGEFEELLLASNIDVTALATDASGDLYLSATDNVIREFTPSGEEVKNTHFPLTVEAVSSLQGGLVLKIYALAVDSSGHLAVVLSEQIPGPFFIYEGLLLDAGTGELITQFTVPAAGSDGIAFNAAGDLYAATGGEAGEVEAYEPVNVGEVTTLTAECKAGADVGSSATFACLLTGDVNPFNVPETEAWFQWGKTCALGKETPKTLLATGEALVGVSSQVEGLRPNDLWCYRLVATDHNVKLPELLAGRTAEFATPAVVPRVVGEPKAEFVGSSSAVLLGELNPENSKTGYFFEYGEQLETYCNGALRTGALESGVYGKVATTLEATHLQPATTYRYRLCAVDQTGDARDEHGGSEIAEGAFTTLPVPVPQAQTGGYTELGATSATISGSVNPDGQPAAYTFELGVYNGAATQYGVVFSGAVSASTVSVPETLALTGLQPGTTYAYLIKVSSGYGTAAGVPVTFTTSGLPLVLSPPGSPPLLAVPSIRFPKAAATPKTKKKPKKGHKAKKRAGKKTSVHKHKSHKGKK